MSGPVQTCDVAVLGGGPAGLTAAAVVARAGLDVSLVEELTVGGRLCALGALVAPPDGMPAHGADMAARLLQDALDAGASLTIGRATCVRAGGPLTVELDGQTLSCRGLVVATGCEMRSTNIPRMADFRGRGVSSCATCDGPLYTGKKIVVVGGGNSAAAEALELAGFAAHITMIFREGRLHCSAELMTALGECANIALRPSSSVVALRDEAGILQAVDVETAAGRQTLATDGVFAYPGVSPSDPPVGEDAFERDNEGYLRTDCDSKGCRRGLFAAGDVVSGSRRDLVSAIESGRHAARGALAYLRAVADAGEAT